MRHTNLFRFLTLGLTCVFFGSVTGCGSQRSSLPATVVVELPDGTSVSVEQGSGVPSLANSAWELIGANGQAFVIIRFGPNGELTKFDDNTIASDILGTTLLFDGESHDTGVPPVQYTAVTFGAQTSTGTGFGFQGLLSASVPIIGSVGTGETSATGTFSANDPNVMTGTFTYSFEVNANLPFDIPISTDNLNGTIQFTATRVD